MNLFVWLNADESRYLALDQTLLFGCCALAVVAAFSAKLDARLATRRGTLGFLALVLLVLLAARWPTFFVRHRLNPDEAQMTAQAITAFHDPIPWLGFDGGTSGPLNTYVLMVPALVGATVSFMTTRIVAVLLEFGAIASLFMATSLVFDTVIARVALLPPLIFWSVSTQDDFVHYSSEHLSIFLSSAALALLCLAWRRGYPPGLVALAGLVPGLLPFAKLQSVPLAAALEVLGLASLIGASALPLRVRLRRVALFVCAGIAYPAAQLGVVALAGSFPDFWNSYIVTALAYSSGTNEPVTFLSQSLEFGPYFDWLLVVTLVGAVILSGRSISIGARIRNAFFAALLVLAGAIDAIYSPHHASPHYLLFGVVPLAAAAAAGLAAIAWFLDPSRTASARRGALAFVFVAASLAVQNAVVRPHYNWLGYDFYEYLQGGPEDPLSAAIRQKLRPGDRLAIWGWVPEYWVFSQTLLGTRDSVSVFQFEPLFNPCRDYFQRRYIADFERVRPLGFLDAGAESFDFTGATAHGYKEFPALATLIDRDYVLAATWKRFRFFVRRAPPSRAKS